MLTEQICSGPCGNVLSISEFSFRRDSQDYRRVCKRCIRTQRQARIIVIGKEVWLEKQRKRARVQRKKKPQIQRNAHRRWVIKNRARANEIQRRYAQRTDHATDKKWRDNNRERWNAYMRDYQATRKAKNGDMVNLIHQVRALLPPSLPPEMREDVSQQVLVSILSGECRLSSLKTAIKNAIRDCNRFGNSFQFTSMDAPLSESGLTLADVLEG